jgi:excisionase family DNA binding protein
MFDSYRGVREWIRYYQRGDVIGNLGLNKMKLPNESISDGCSLKNEKTRDPSVLSSDAYTIVQSLNIFTSKEAAVYLRTTPGTIRNLVSLGRLKAERFGSRLRFKREVLNRFLEKERG